ncbi:hypothetical protein A4G99_23675 [Haladaptatus sp. R4]|uniref:hypothetical protein n=1 Tax=Haladaptatus sp. R4 TaxID=1679489 RepID=UPI0007B45F69|nr:hypothetical protein [Haladaptatus sp. R4]KZN26010.1 hypothetical protein A4G99_23675 [Haladaptatus sp. R4]
MGREDDVALSVAEFVDYCETQAGLLMGNVETMTTEADALLDDIDDRVSEVRARLEDSPEDVETAEHPPSTDGPEREVDTAAVTELEREIEETQAVVEAKRARIVAFRELADGYGSLADDLRSEVDDGREALDRVVRFEADADAPVYFDDRQTVYEAATSEESRDK